MVDLEEDLGPVGFEPAKVVFFARLVGVAESPMSTCWTRGGRRSRRCWRLWSSCVAGWSAGPGPWDPRASATSRLGPTYTTDAYLPLRRRSPMRYCALHND